MTLPSKQSESVKKDRFYIQTFGCQMNAADSERMAVLLTDSGMQPASCPEEASVVIINGCAIREKAVHKALSLAGTFQKQKRAGLEKAPIIGVGGCVGQLNQKQLFDQIPAIDFVFGTDAIDQLPEMIDRVRKGSESVLEVEWEEHPRYTAQTRLLVPGVQASVPIMKGCDKFCSYCIVPQTRGREKSRTIAEVVDNIAELVAQGVREVLLLGQNVNSFGKGNPNHYQRLPLTLSNPIGPVGPRKGEENFPQLLWALEHDPRCQDLKRIRFTSSHPLDFSDQLIACYHPQKGVTKLAAHLHLPVQSGSNRILKKMGRHHSREAYLAQMEQWRQVAPEASLSTDFIVGFPTETEEDFEQTLDLVQRLEFDQIYAFAYSPRPGTRASQFEDLVPETVKKQRLHRLLALHRRISFRKNQNYLGKKLEILVEGLSSIQRTHDPQQRLWMGRTSCHRLVHLSAPQGWEGKGQFVQVQIGSATAHSLMGQRVGESATEPLEMDLVNL